MNPNPYQERAARFVAALRSLNKKQDRAALAALRRGLSDATVIDAWPVVSRLGGDIGQPGECAFVDIAALYATHPEESDARNFGETCRRIAWAKGELSESHERRFRRLLAADSSSDLVGQLRSWIRFAANENIGVNYESLFLDIRAWNNWAENIRIRWARSFWNAESPTTDAPSKTPSETTAL